MKAGEIFMVILVLLALLAAFEPSLVHALFGPILGCRGPGCG